MIASLQKKFILISAVSIFAVFSGIFLLLVFFSNHQLDRTMDTLADAISAGDGVFPEFDPSQPSRPFPYDDIINEETRFSTRFFTVWVDEQGRITHINIDSVLPSPKSRWRTTPGPLWLMTRSAAECQTTATALWKQAAAPRWCSSTAL